MKQKKRHYLCTGLCMLALFALWTTLLVVVDVREIGPQGTKVGFASMNQFVHRLTGVHMTLYHITDWLGLVPVAFGLGFALLGLIQWIQRKSVCKVDFSILILGCFYIATLVTYLLFETVVINYRPVLIDGFLEVSYPSSTTLLVMCVMPTAVMQLNARIKNQKRRNCICTILILFIAFMVLGRLISGVHWVSDIIGGAFVSAGLVMIYHAIAMEK